ncbi:MAG TPA: EAL domain-containing protein [Rhodanobacter sp.]|nr:EAL domain-containing protein [Rhodanobacter sp.]
MKAERILLALADVAAAETVAGQLAAAGYPVARARDASDALALARANPPALVLLDQQLAGADGVALLQHFKADPRLTGAFVVLQRSPGATGHTAHSLQADACVHAFNCQVGLDDLVASWLQLRRTAATLQELIARQHPPQLEAEHAIILERIALGAPLTDVLAELARVVERQCPGTLCAILQTDHDGAQLRMGAAPSLPPSFARAVDGTPIGPDAGSCGTAAHERRTVVAADIASDPRWREGRQLALGHGLRACTSLPMFDDDGRIRGTLALYSRTPGQPATRAMDLLEACAHIAGIAIARQRVEDGRRAGASLLHTARTIIDLGYWSCDLQTGHMAWSADACRLFGVAAQAFDGSAKAFLACVHPEDRDRVRQATSRAIDGRQPVETEYRICRPDGVERVMFSRCDVVHADDGTTLRVAGVVMDVTVARRTASALSESEQRYQSLFSQNPDAVCSLDLDGNFLSVNPAFSQLTGYSKQEIRELGGRPLISGASTPLTDAQFTLAARGQAVIYEAECIAKDGRRFQAMVTNVPIVVDGRIVGVYGIAKDITERKRAEEHLRATRERMQMASQMARLGGWEISVQGDRVSWSDEVCAIFELPPGTLPCKGGGLRRYAPEYRERAHALFDACVRDGTPFDEELQIVAAHGRRVWVRSIGQAVRDESGAVVRVQGVLQDITSRKIDEQKIQHLAFYDPLTGLPNRQLLLDRLQQALTSHARSGKCGALLFIDMDNFKALNDTLGHAKGDQQLIEVARRLGSLIRNNDTVARLGGDEFVVMLEGLDGNLAKAAIQAKSIAETLLAALGLSYQLDNFSHHGSASIGVTLFHDTGESTHELLKRADMAMYQAKAAGRNTVCFFDPKMQAAVNARVALEADLREGLQHQHFQLFYQPQVNRSGRTTGVEALLRWNHPRRGLIYPDAFIALAEETRLILPLGQWVLETACRQLATWSSVPACADLDISVNVSARQFHHRGFVQQVIDTLQRSGANPARLKLELTESLLLTDVDEVIEKMTTLKARGVGFSLDDFGTGYSSMSYLKRLPLDELKIDRSFVNDVLTDANDAVIVRSIVALGQSLGLTVLAEGVETEGQRDFLTRHDCHAHQGYLFSRPIPIDQFETWFAKQALAA